MTAVKYTSAQMSLIDYQAMNTGSKKFRSSPYARVRWAKHQATNGTRRKRPASSMIRYRQNADAATKGRQKQYDM